MEEEPLDHKVRYCLEQLTNTPHPGWTQEQLQAHPLEKLFDDEVIPEHLWRHTNSGPKIQWETWHHNHHEEEFQNNPQQSRAGRSAAEVELEDAKKIITSVRRMNKIRRKWGLKRMTKEEEQQLQKRNRELKAKRDVKEM